MTRIRFDERMLPQWFYMEGDLVRNTPMVQVRTTVYLEGSCGNIAFFLQGLYRPWRQPFAIQSTLWEVVSVDGLHGFREGIKFNTKREILEEYIAIS